MIWGGLWVCGVRVGGGFFCVVWGSTDLCPLLARSGGGGVAGVRAGMGKRGEV